MADVEAERERNIAKMCDKLSIDRDQAIKLASDFYRTYPMLLEYVRTPEFMANN
jgi:hypothetical protein